MYGILKSVIGISVPNQFQVPTGNLVFSYPVLLCVTLKSEFWIGGNEHMIFGNEWNCIREK